MVAAPGDALAGDAGEVADVLGYDRISLVSRTGQNIGVRPAGEPELDRGNGVDAPLAQGQSGWIYLIEEKLHPASATAVS